MRPKSVKRSDLSTIKMVAGNEKRITRVIDGSTIKNWVGFGWVDEGPATLSDYDKYPIIEEV